MIVPIRKQHTQDGEPAVFMVPAVAITTTQGKRLIPNPSGNEVCTYDSLEAAKQAIERAGFDFEYEGQRAVAGFSRLSGDHRSQLIQALILQLDDREPTVITQAATALGGFMDSIAMKPLIQLLGHMDPNVRKAASETLGKLGAVTLPELKHTFLEATGANDKTAPHIRVSVLIAYQAMLTYYPETLNDILPHLVRATRDENWLVRAQAALTACKVAELTTPVAGKS
jgi:hypothetical protein